MDLLRPNRMKSTGQRCYALGTIDDYTAYVGRYTGHGQVYNAVREYMARAERKAGYPLHSILLGRAGEHKEGKSKFSNVWMVLRSNHHHVLLTTTDERSITCKRSHFALALCGLTPVYRTLFWQRPYKTAIVFWIGFRLRLLATAYRYSFGVKTRTSSTFLVYRRSGSLVMYLYTDHPLHPTRS